MIEQNELPLSATTAAEKIVAAKTNPIDVYFNSI